MELFTPSFGLVFWMFVVFVLLCLLLGKFAWPAIIKMMSERADLIDKGVAYAQEAKQHMDNAKAEADKFILDAKKQQSEILREAARMKAQIIEDAKEAATLEAKKVMPLSSLSLKKERKRSCNFATRLVLLPFKSPKNFCANAWQTTRLSRNLWINC